MVSYTVLYKKLQMKLLTQVKYGLKFIISLTVKVSSEVSKEAPFTNFNLHYNTDRELSLYDDTTINILKLLKYYSE